MAAVPTSPGWVEIWSDEFDGAELNPDKWEHEINCSGGGNNEAQCYTDRALNSFIDEDGVLNIVAREENFSGPAQSQGSPDYSRDDTSATRAYTSARLRTKNRFDFKYGRIDVRAQLPAGQGSWPAIWMLPSDWVYGGWPSSGEIDIMEAINLGTEGAKNSVHGTLHYGLKWPQWSVVGAEYVASDSFTEEFHTYSIEWEADEIRWFVDGIHYQTQRSSGWYNYIWHDQQTGFEVANPRAPFDQRFHLLLNLAIGGHAPGPPDSDWKANREMLIDYVRVYQCSVDNDEGQGCASQADAVVDTEIEVTADKGGPTVNRFTLYDHGPVTLALKMADEMIANRIVVSGLSDQPGSVQFDSRDDGGNHGPVLEIDFNGPGSVSLSSTNMHDVANVANGFALKGGEAWTNYGTIEFDLFVESIDSNTTLVARMGSHFPNYGEYEIKTAGIGSWSHVVIRISDLIARPLAIGSGIDINRIHNLLSIAAIGSADARIRLDNITLACVVNENAKSWQPDPVCSIGPVLELAALITSTDIFRDELGRWKPRNCCGGATSKILTDDVDPARGNVIEFRYETDETVTMLESVAPMDFSALAGGNLEFDLLVIRNPDNPAPKHPWLMTISCGHPCDAGNVSLTSSVEGLAPVPGVWQHFTFRLDELVARGLDLQQVVAPLVIYPSWGHQYGALFRIDNVVVNAPRLGAIKLGE